MKSADSTDDGADFGLVDANPETAARAARVREAVSLAGGNKVVIANTEISKTTLGNYLKGSEMKLSSAIQLARAAGVRLEWLATGAGPKSDPVAASGAPANSSRALFSQIDADRLGEAYQMARKALAAHGHRNPEPRRLVQVMVLIYDELNSPAESSPSNDPQDSQAAIHEGS